MFLKCILCLSPGSLFRLFEKLGFKNKFNYLNIYPTTHDAVIYILKERKSSEALMPSISLMHDELADSSRPEADRRHSSRILADGHLTSSIVNIHDIEPVYVDSEKSNYNAFRQITDDIMKL